MIKIIQYGTKQVRVCNTCGCKFTFDKENVKRKKKDTKALPLVAVSLI